MGRIAALCVFCKEKPGIYKKVCCASPFCSVVCGKITGCCRKNNKDVILPPEGDVTGTNTTGVANAARNNAEIDYPVKELSDKEKWELGNNEKLVKMLKDTVVQCILEKIAKSTITGNETSTLSQYVRDPEFMAIADEIVMTIEKANASS